jgi:hypothetical protein
MPSIPRPPAQPHPNLITNTRPTRPAPNQSAKQERRTNPDPPPSARAAVSTKTEERRAALIRERREAEARACTFHPAISRRSDKLMAGRVETLRALNVSAHHQLYQDSVRRMVK